MKKISSLVETRQPKRAKGCDARITITDNIVLVEYTNGPDLALERVHPKAIHLINFIKL